MTEVPNAVYDFTLYKDWYDKNNPKFEPPMFRAEFFPINWKSKVGNSDLNYNFYTDTHQDVHKGDIVVCEDGTIHMLNWEIQQYINAKTTQAIACNHMLEVYREIEAKADSRGYKVTDAHRETIAPSIPCVMSEYAGRPDFQVAQNSPGIHADMLTIADVQYNENTDRIRIDDQFEWGYFTYRVIGIDQSQLNIDRTMGILRLYARRVAGEDL